MSYIFGNITKVANIYIFNKKHIWVLSVFFNVCPNFIKIILSFNSKVSIIIFFTSVIYLISYIFVFGMVVAITMVEDINFAIKLVVVLLLSYIVFKDDYK